MHRLLFLSHTASWGGAEKCLYLLLKGLPRDVYTPIVLLPETGELETALRELGIETLQAPMIPVVGDCWPEREFTPLAQRVAEVAQIIDEHRIDVVITNTCVIAEGAFAAGIRGVPHIWHVLELLHHDPWLTPLCALKPFHTMLDLLSDRIVAVSESVKDEITRDAAQARVDVVPTGLERLDTANVKQRKETLFELPENAPVVTFAGILSKRKGVTDLVRSAPAVLKKHPATRFLLVGTEGDDADNIKRLIDQLGLTESFRLCGYRRDVLDVLASSDIAVMPSVADALPLAVMEAMSVGTPVVATRSGGCADLIVSGQSGLLVDPRSPDSLAGAIITLLDDPKLRQSMGRNGQLRLSQEFPFEKHGEQWDRLLRETLESRSAKRRDVETLELLLGFLTALEQEHRALLSAQAALDAAMRTFASYESHFLMGPALRIRRKLLKLWKGEPRAAQGGVMPRQNQEPVRRQAPGTHPTTRFSNE